MKEELLFKDWADEWLSRQKNFIKESSYGTYSTMLYNHLIPNIGEHPIDEIDEQVIQKLILQLRTKGRKDGRGGLSDKTVKNIITVLKVCLMKAGKQGYIIYQKPDLFYPRADHLQKLNILSKNDQIKIQNYVLNNLTYKNFGILFALQTGVRIGELCAIQFKDIDFGQNLVSINRTLQRTFIKTANGDNITKIIITPPKTSSSARTIPLSNVLIAALKTFRGFSPNNYLITGSDKHIEPRSYSNYYRKVLDKLDVDYLKFHALRHTFATRCIEAGGDSKIVSELLGHSSIRITLDLYVHPQIEAKRKCVELVNNI